MTRWLALAAVVIVLDQWSKHAVSAALVLGQGVELTSFFNLVLAHNRGAAFSFLADADGWQRGFFVAIAVVASLWVIYLLRKHPRETLFCAALGLILGGAIGNLIDRVSTGVVVDFLDFYVGSHHFPAFNLADSAITCGAALLILDGLRTKRG